MSKYQIDSFALRQWSSRTMPSKGVAMAGIYLYAGDEYCGDVYFYANGTDIKHPSLDANTGRIHLHFDIAQYAIVLDLLRNEDAIVLYFDSPSDAGLHSGKDPFAADDPTVL